MSVPTRTPVLQVFLLFLAGLCAAGQFAKISIIFSDVRTLYPEAGNELGFLVSLLSLVGVVLGLFAGLVVARIGFRRILLTALIVGAAISLYQSSLPPLPLMLLSRAIEGAAHLSIVVAAPTLITALAAPRHHPLVMTLWSTVFGVTFALTAWLGVPLVAAHGPAALFLAHAGMLAGVAVLLFLLLPRDRIVPRSHAPLSFGEIARRHVEVYTSPALAAPAAGFVFYALSYVSLMTLLPDYIDPAWRTLTVTAMPLASTAASLISGATLLRRFSAVSVIMAGFVIGATSVLALIVLPGNPLISVTLFVALGLLQGGSFASIPEINKGVEAQALANGAVAQAGNLGNMLGTPVLLTLGSFGGFATMIGLVGVFQLSGLTAHALLRRARNAAS